ncbi:MAG: PIN domain-containing protein [archaeon]
MEVLLDANFIISCVRKRIDFIDELEVLGFKVKVPREVLQELKDLKREKKLGRETRTAINIAFQMLDDGGVKKVGVGGRTVDEGLIAKGKEGVYIATLDKEILRGVPNKIVIDNSKKGLKVERE